MTYQDIIYLVDNELRDQEAWPDDDSKAQEQINKVYDAMVMVAARSPLNRIALHKKKEHVLSGDQGVYRIPLPEDVFNGRPDLGVRYVDVNTQVDGALEMAYRVHVDQFLPTSILVRSSENDIMKGETRVAVDERQQMLLVMGVKGGDQIALNYAPLPEKPNTGGDLSDIPFPLRGSDAVAVVQLVAAHVSGVTIRDNEASTIHSMFAKLYSNQ